MKNFLFIAIIIAACSPRVAPSSSPEVPYLHEDTTYLPSKPDTVRIPGPTVIKHDTVCYRDTIRYLILDTITKHDTVSIPVIINLPAQNSKSVYELPFPSGGDDQETLQANCDTAIIQGYKSIHIPTFGYHLSQGLVLRDPAGGFLNGVTLYADGGDYGAPTFYVTNPGGFGINVLAGKGVKVENVLVQGLNTGVASYSVAQVLSGDSSSFVTNGVSATRSAPHAGFVVDGLFYGPTTIQGGSTDVQFIACRADYFTVGFCLQPGGGPQANGECIRLINCWGEYCRSAISVGQSQERSVSVEHFKCWGWTKTVFDMVNFGNGTSCAPDVTDLNVAGCVRYLCELNTWINKGLTVQGSHMESLYSLGGCFTGTNGILTIKDGWVAFQGNSGGCTPPATIYQGATLTVNGGDFFQYGAPNPGPLAITVLSASMTDVLLDWIPTNTSHGSGIAFTRCTAAGYPFGDDLVVSDGAWPSEIASQNFLWMGRMSIRYSTGPGQVTRTRIEDGQPYEWLIPALVLGDLTAGSDTVKNLTVEGNGQFPNPPALYMPEFPAGTTIVSKTDSTLVMSAAALVTEQNAAILSGNWQGEMSGTPSMLGNFFHCGWKYGDRIINNRQDLYPGVTEFLCTKSGITGTSRIPFFKEQ